MAFLEIGLDGFLGDRKKVTGSIRNITCLLQITLRALTGQRRSSSGISPAKTDNAFKGKDLGIESEMVSVFAIKL